MSVPRDLADARADFPSLARMTGGERLAYLDGPAGTQVPQTVIDAVASYYRTCNANTHGQFATSRESDAAIAESRGAMAALLGAAGPSTISFGANMTTLAFSLSHALARELVPGDEIVITELDHEANRGPWLGLAKHGVVVREAALRWDGALDYQDLAAKVTPRTRLVAVGLASNALGTVNDVTRIRELARAVQAWLLLDAVHYAPHFPIDVEALDADFLLCSAYKFYGPHVGILYTRPGLLDRLRPDRLRTQEGDAPARIETGTLNHAALVGVTAAVSYIASWGEGEQLRSRLIAAMCRIGEHEHALARYYHDRVSDIPGVTVWGPDFSSRLRAPTVSITIAGLHPRDAARFLAARGIAVWDGDFYAARAVEVLGLAEHGGLLRTGISLYNTREELDRLLAGIEDLACRGAS
jgi:cysteine desulfurase family protein (TIGR01976 family)